MKPQLAAQLIQQVESDYNTIAGHFSQTRGRSWPIIEQLLKKYTTPGQHLLDVGCGNGRVADVADKFKLDYTGIDLSANLIAEADRLRPSHDFVWGDMTQLPFPDEQFDAIIVVASFHHIPSQALRLQTLAELRRVIALGGVIMLINWNLHQRRFRWARFKTNLEKLLWRHQRDWNDVLIPWKNADGVIQTQRYYHGYTINELKQLAASGGLVVLEQYYETNGKRTNRTNGANLVTILKKPFT